jgi:hypothetical protein
MSIQEQIGKIEEMSKQLNSLAIEVNPLIKQLDDSLRKMEVGIEVWIEPPLEKLSNAHIELGYGRTDQTYCSLAVRSVDIDSGETKWTRPLQQCSRDMRIAAVARFPQLFTEILKKLDAEIVQAGAARRELPNLVDIFHQLPKKRRT